MMDEVILVERENKASNQIRNLDDLFHDTET